jgi:hypothetical protein
MWAHLGDVILVDHTASVRQRIPVDVLVPLAEKAADSDEGRAYWRGHYWDRDDLHAAVDFAIHVGLVASCTWADKWTACERPVTDYSVPPRCGWHRKD